MRWTSIAVAVMVWCAAEAHESAAQRVPVFAPGVHTATLERAAGMAVGYAISIPDGYKRTTHGPLVLALHFGVPGGSSDGAGRELLELLIGPGFAALGAVIVAPDAIDGRPWNTPQNEE